VPVGPLSHVFRVMFAIAREPVSRIDWERVLGSDSDAQRVGVYSISKRVPRFCPLGVWVVFIFGTVHMR
jgi:hypothetical protein